MSEYPSGKQEKEDAYVIGDIPELRLSPDPHDQNHYLFLHAPSVQEYPSFLQSTT